MQRFVCYGNILSKEVDPLLNILYKKGYRKHDIEKDVLTNVYAQNGEVVARIDFDTEVNTGKIKGINFVEVYDSDLEKLLNLRSNP